MSVSSAWVPPFVVMGVALAAVGLAGGLLVRGRRGARAAGWGACAASAAFIVLGAWPTGPVPVAVAAWLAWPVAPILLGAGAGALAPRAPR